MTATIETLAPVTLTISEINATLAALRLVRDAAKQAGASEALADYTKINNRLIESRAKALRDAPALVEAAKPVEAKPATAPARFEVGKTYGCRSACDHDTIFRYTVTKRTASNIWVESRGRVTRRKVAVSFGEEVCYPEGKYSMCPVLRPSRVG